MSHTSQLDDAVSHLVQRAQAGDTDARDELLSRCQPTVYRWALVHTGDPDDADDVAQEVLLRLYRSLHRYSGRSRFTTWLYQVTRNTSLSLGRRLATRLRAIRSVAADPPAGTTSDEPNARIHGTRVTEVVMTLFRELPVRQREVFYLADLEGVAPVEIAERLGMNPITVRAHLFRARRTLRARILERHPEIAEERNG